MSNFDAIEDHREALDRYFGNTPHDDDDFPIDDSDREPVAPLGSLSREDVDEIRALYDAGDELAAQRLTLDRMRRR